VAPADSAAKPISDTVYRDIAVPVRCEKSRRTSTGSSTLPVAIAAPASAVPRNSRPTPGMSRSSMPASRTNIAPASAVRTPSRRASTGASGASRPKQSTGSVVSAPAHPDDRPVSDWMRLSTGPIAAAAGRRLIAISTTPAASRAERKRAWGFTPTA
jgi:hypothetical protein